MCGICGVASLDGTAPDRRLLAEMSASLAHRGPDSAGEVLDGPVGLAARRLAIIDLETGDQPVANEDDTVRVVQNGEIYNYAELREGLAARGHRFRTHGDTEVLAHLYEERGLEFVHSLRGMFAVAIWDAPARRLVLARDRFGIKPLYWGRTAGRLSFASELKALLCQPDLSREIDLDALEAYLALGCVPGPMTIFTAARKLQPGHLLVWEGGEPRVGRWAPPWSAPNPALADASDGELADEIVARLRDSVAAHLVSDVPVGILLSGGVDSSLLVALAAEQSSEPVRTFSIGFEEREFNELAEARRVARRYATDHHELLVAPRAADLLPRLVDIFDEPFADSSALPTYLVSELAARHVKVAFSGEGGDEVFGGYYAYAADVMAPFAGPPAAALRPLIERLPASRAGRGFEDRVKRFAAGARLDPIARHHAFTRIFSPEARDELLGPGRAADRFDPVRLFRAPYDEAAGADRLARFQAADIAVPLVDDLLTKADRASMAHSLELRVPFLDPLVVELGLSLPRAAKVRLLAKKRLLRAAAEPLVPAETIKGPKRGFSIPAAAWLRGDLLPLVREALSEEAVRRQGFFDPAVVSSLVEAHVGRKRDLSRQLWTLLAFSLWHDRVAPANGG